MKMVTVSKLKASLSEYLRQVKAGEEVFSDRAWGDPLPSSPLLSVLTPCLSTWLKWKNRDLLSVGPGSCQKASGICLAPRTQRG